MHKTHTGGYTHDTHTVFPISTIYTLKWSWQSYQSRGGTVQSFMLQVVSQRTQTWMPNERLQLGFGIVFDIKLMDTNYNARILVRIFLGEEHEIFTIA